VPRSKMIDRGHWNVDALFKHMPATKKKKIEEPVQPTPSVVSSKIRVKIRAYDNKVIDKSTKIIIDAVIRSGARIVGPVPLPTEKTKYTVLKSTFVHKNARDQYEMRVHKRLIDIVDPSAKTIDAISNLSLPAGVDIEIKMM